MANTKLRLARLEYLTDTAGELALTNSTSDKDVLVKINDGGTTRTAIQVHGDEGSLSFPRQSNFLVYKTASQSINTGTYTTVVFGAATYDVLGEWDNANDRFTVKDTGFYIVSGRVLWQNTNSDIVYRIGFSINGGIGDNTVVYDRSAFTAVYRQQQMTLLVYLTAGQYVSLVVWQNSGGAETIYEGIGHFAVSKVA